MSRRILAIIVAWGVLLTAAVTSASCGPSDIQHLTTSPALGLAATGQLAEVKQLGDAIISYLDGEGDLATLKQLVAPEGQAGLSKMLSSLSRPTSYVVLGGAAHMENNYLYVDLLFEGGESKHDEFTLQILYDPDKGTMTITGIKPGPNGFG
jgi:hypothetical protein